ncbi:protocadherin beta-13-like [Protopterus annectens]|uniref:protocadherin beta-13-like n=1 Tax=Protopterus annectens TaxID=7888 RepID=UPI001CF9AB33|nr:protocadherin beta-13-like [Protopterus annectens]
MEPGLLAWKLVSSIMLENAAQYSPRILLWLVIFLFLTPWRCCFGDIIFTIQEELPNGELIGNLNKYLGIGDGKYTNRELSVVFADSKQYLFINPESGNMFVNERIDREMLCGAKSLCYIILRVVMKYPFQLFNVKMEISDINDNAPVFPVNDLHISIMEYVPVGTIFPIQSASDQDVGSNGIQIYRLSSDDYFSLNMYNSTNGGLMAQLVLNKSLDREHKSLHHLLVIAVDGGEPQRTGTLQIVINVIDANDNSPTFEKPLYTVSLAEDATIGTLIIQLKATDLDVGMNGEILYSFSSHTPKKLRDKFDLNSSSGEIRLKNKIDLEETGPYELHVQAADKGPSAMTGYCKVLLEIIDVNNNLPEIAITPVSNQILEDADAGTVVALVSITDRDFGVNALVNCQITDNIPFKLRSVSDYYTLITDGPLDRETVGSYNITVTATDAGSPPLSTETNIVVQIADVNDNSPRFSQGLYKVYINENNSVGDFICQVTALDPDLDQNSIITYILLETDINSLPIMNYVSISNDNGNVYARSVFDYETQKNFEILIEARDQGKPPLRSTATVEVSIVDQNDNPPMFLYPPTTEGYIPVEMVPRSAEVGFLVTKVITVDADSGQNAWLSYHLLHASDTSLVSVDGQTGEIKILRNIRVTDPNKHRLIIEVRDNGAPKRSASVTIGLWLYDTFPQVLPDFQDAEISDNPISSLNIYLIITVVSVSFLFVGFLMIIISVMCYKQDYANYCPCFSICCDLQIERYRVKSAAPLNSALPTDLLDIAGSETLSHSYQYKAFVGFVPHAGTMIPVNYSTGDSGNNIVSEGHCVQITSMEGNPTQGGTASSSIPSECKSLKELQQSSSVHYFQKSTVRSQRTSDSARHQCENIIQLTAMYQKTSPSPKQMTDFHVSSVTSQIQENHYKTEF